MDAASSRKIDDIRNLIEQTKYKPNVARFKVFIIDEVHMLTREAFNALLKTLEEPPEYVKFILATTDPMKLPPTILSRTQHFRFKKIANSEVVKHLSSILNLENIEYEKEALSMLSRAGNGSLRDTLTLLDQAILYSKKYVDAKSVALMLGILDPILLDKIINSILKSDKETVLKYIKELESHESEVVIDELIAYVKEKFFEEDARFSTLLSDRFFRLLAESKSQLYLNADSGFTLTLLFFKMIEATKIQEVDIMIDSLESKLTLTPTPKKEPVSNEIAKSEVKKEQKSSIELPKTEEDNHQQTYKTLISKLHDRNYELGECFKSYVDFVSFEDGTLNLRSSADKDCQNSLRDKYGIIKHFVQDVFGIDVKLKVDKVEATKDETVEVSVKKETPEENQGSSCVENQIIGESREVERGDILEDPFVQKAKELFEPSKIVVKSKV
jgi:DNA polymerase-3 subunit gamma/tau